jgi:hypothetical protein
MTIGESQTLDGKRSARQSYTGSNIVAAMIASNLLPDALQYRRTDARSIAHP